MLVSAERLTGLARAAAHHLPSASSRPLSLANARSPWFSSPTPFSTLTALALQLQPRLSLAQSVPAPQSTPTATSETPQMHGWNSPRLSSADAHTRQLGHPAQSGA